MVLQRFEEFVNEINSSNSRLHKESVLEKYKDEDEIKEIIKFIYNPYIVTGISSKKANRYDYVVVKEIFSDDELLYYTDIMNLLEYFQTHITGRDDDLIELNKFIYFDIVHKDLIKSIVCKDLKIGVQATTINKIWGEHFIPTFDVMLAQKYFDNPDKLLPDGTEFILTTKLDGVRCVLFNVVNPTFFSRQGKSIEGLVELIDEAHKLPFGYVYDGELLLDKQGLESKDLYRETMKVVSADGDKVNIVFNVFDMIPVKDFIQGYYSASAKERKEEIARIFTFNSNLKHYKEVKVLYCGKDKSEITNKLDEITSAGGEGVMINLADAPYECKRSKGLLKVKKMQTADVRVIALEPGTGKNYNKLGALKVEFIGPDGKIYTCSVGSGLTDEDRLKFWNHPELIEGKIIEIQYFEISSNQNGTYGLRFPVFKWIREDKTDVSMY